MWPHLWSLKLSWCEYFILRNKVERGQWVNRTRQCELRWGEECVVYYSFSPLHSHSWLCTPFHAIWDAGVRLSPFTLSRAKGQMTLDIFPLKVKCEVFLFVPSASTQVTVSIFVLFMQVEMKGEKHTRDLEAIWWWSWHGLLTFSPLLARSLDSLLSFSLSHTQRVLYRTLTCCSHSLLSTFIPP